MISAIAKSQKHKRCSIWEKKNTISAAEDDVKRPFTAKQAGGGTTTTADDVAFNIHMMRIYARFPL